MVLRRRPAASDPNDRHRHPNRGTRTAARPGRLSQGGPDRLRRSAGRHPAAGLPSTSQVPASSQPACPSCATSAWTASPATSPRACPSGRPSMGRETSSSTSCRGAERSRPCTSVPTKTSVRCGSQVMQRARELGSDAKFGWGRVHQRPRRSGAGGARNARVSAAVRSPPLASATELASAPGARLTRGGWSRRRRTCERLVRHACQPGRATTRAAPTDSTCKTARE